MNKICSLLLAVLLPVTLAACSGGDGSGQNEVSGDPVGAVEQESPAPSQSETEHEESTESEAADDSQSEPDEPSEADGDTSEEPSDKILLVYFSHTGNTRSIADSIAGKTDADVAEIVPVDPYPVNYSDNLAIARQELDDDARPAIQADLPDIAEYDVIILGYPIWHGSFPRPVATFLESANLSGKTVVPFCTSGSTSIARSVGELEELVLDATILTGLGITDSTLGNAEQLVDEWLAGLDLLLEAE